jgi:hypothetical protein
MVQNKKIVAIHQPNFFPWLGFFNKIYKADTFIFLDHVQFSKSQGTWSNRVKLLLNKTPTWVTAPIERNFSGVKNINEMYFQKNNPWRKKLIKTLEFNYKKAPFFYEILNDISYLVLNEEENISKYNIELIKFIAEKLCISSEKFHLSSDLPIIGHSNEMLISLIKSVGGNIYMCGGGADSYQNEEIFKKNLIQLTHQNFKHPIYDQFNSLSHENGLSILDALFNIGWNNTKQIIT